MGCGRKKSSQYRGVTWSKTTHAWNAQCGISKVLIGMKEKTKIVFLGGFYHEKEAALAFDRACRKFGVPEKELNFPRNQLLNKVRLFDDECYFSCQKNPTDPVATPCNHVFCKTCISSWLEEQWPNGSCPCCKITNLKKDALRPVTLVPWPVEPDRVTLGKNSKSPNRTPHFL
jgi:Zinc finger, C3HC4 type (RING finger)